MAAPVGPFVVPGGSTGRSGPSAAAAPAGPWGGEDPVDWARRTGRVTAASAPRWREDLRRDPAGTAQWLEILHPVLGDESSQRVEAAAARRRNVSSRPTAQLGALATNPALDALPPGLRSSAQANPDAPPAPTLFNSGDVPPLTASGLAPELLYDLPWQARHAVARADTAAAALELFERYVGDFDGAAMDFGASQPVTDYVRRVQQWAADWASPDALYAATYGDDQLAEARKAEQTAKAERRKAAERLLEAIDEE